MVVSITAVLVAISCIFVLGLVKLFAPLFEQRRRGKEILKGVDWLKPHWLFGHLRAV